MGRNGRRRSGEEMEMYYCKVHILIHEVTQYHLKIDVRLKIYIMNLKATIKITKQRVIDKYVNKGDKRES